jgi:Winged helix DNA-binding domain
VDPTTARLRSQRLSGPPATSVAEVVEHLLAIQAQDGRGVRLAVRARSTGLTAADVDRALTEDRSVVVASLNRGTLHLVPAGDYWWLRDLFAPRMATGNRRRLAQEGVTPTQAERGVEVVVTALSSDGPLARDGLKERLDDAGVPTARQALVHVILAASIAHPIARGPVVDGRHAFVDATTWLERPQPVDRDEALALLADRYLRGHGPADERDLAAWSGLPLTDARAGLTQVARPPSRATTLPPPRLLGPFDPVLHGWASRHWVVGDDEKGVVTNNGIFRATAVVDGKVVATWKLSGDELTIEPRRQLDDDTLAALHADGEDVRRYLAS